MRKYEIRNAEGHVVSVQENEDYIAPALLAGHTAKVVEVDGERVAKKVEVVIGPGVETPVPEHIKTEAEAAAERDAARAEREARRAEREAAEVIAAEPAPEPEPDHTA